MNVARRDLLPGDMFTVAHGFKHWHTVGINAEGKATGMHGSKSYAKGPFTVTVIGIVISTKDVSSVSAAYFMTSTGAMGWIWSSDLRSASHQPQRVRELP